MSLKRRIKRRSMRIGVAGAGAVSVLCGYGDYKLVCLSTQTGGKKKKRGGRGGVERPEQSHLRPGSRAAVIINRKKL